MRRLPLARTWIVWATAKPGHQKSWRGSGGAASAPPDYPLTVEPFRIYINDFRNALALADAFGFRPYASGWYLDLFDRDILAQGRYRWWEKASIVRGFSREETDELTMAFERVLVWLSEKPDRVPNAADMHDAQRFYELLAFVRRDDAAQIIRGLCDFCRHHRISLELGGIITIWREEI